MRVARTYTYAGTERARPRRSRGRLTRRVLIDIPFMTRCYTLDDPFRCTLLNCVLSVVLIQYAYNISLCDVITYNCDCPSSVCMLYDCRNIISKARVGSFVQHHVMRFRIIQVYTYVRIRYILYTFTHMM